MIDALGPWPGRVGWLCVLGTIAFALVWAGSEAAHAIARRMERGRAH